MSKIVIHNNTVYTSGQTAADAGDCVRKQTKACLDKVDSLLQEAGTNKSRALSATIWLKNIDADFKSMNEVWNGWVDPKNKPVRATVEAAMARPGILVEIQVTAATV
jgi:enamine deaminase RidA (YjgF/YER057c/UK114 family)